MSYSFSVRAASKVEACEMVANKLQEVVLAQPVHSEDKEQALRTAETFISLLAVDDTKDVAVSMNGSIYKSEAGVQQASVTVSANLVAKEKA